MKGEISKEYKFLFFLIPFLFVGFVITITLTKVNTRSTFEEYPLVKCGESINLTVGSVSTFKGTSLISNYNGTKLSIRAFNWNLKNSYLQNHLVVGDSITREAYSKTLYLHKKDGSVIKFEFQCFEK